MTVARPSSAGRADVVVVGAGLAGLRAARDCTAAGRHVVVLEARDRVGGRAHTSGRQVLGVDVELGGTWAAPGQHEVLAECRRYGLDMRGYDAPTHVRWRTGGRLRQGMPVDMAHWADLERVLATIRHDSMLDPAPPWLRALSCQAYLDGLAAHGDVVDAIHGWLVMMTGARLDQVAAVDPLGVIADHGGVSGLLTSLASSPQPGWEELARRMARDAGDVRLDAAVTGVSPSADATLDVALADGSHVTAATVVVAVPVNVLPTLELPGVATPEIRAVSGSNVGAVAKVWMLVDGVPVGSLASGRGEGLDWLYAPASHGEATLVLGFGLPGPSFRPGVRHDVERALHAFFPEAVLHQSHHHDWVGDPWARGTYVATPAGSPDLFGAGSWPGVGAVEFAGSDLAPAHLGWFEGALLSGRDAAARILARR